MRKEQRLVTLRVAVPTWLISTSSNQPKKEKKKKTDCVHNVFAVHSDGQLPETQLLCNCSLFVRTLHQISPHPAAHQSPDEPGCETCSRPNSVHCFLPLRRTTSTLTKNTHPPGFLSSHLAWTRTAELGLFLPFVFVRTGSSRKWLLNLIPSCPQWPSGPPSGSLIR
ncbi:hypothetical protein VTK26DRAFT_8508 [Humicola hyalothermophila]